MEIASDPYELKLFQMFQSCDKERCGLLDEESLGRLCGLLELQDKGAVLIADLSATSKPDAGISFERFKEALLNFLGTELELDASEHKHTNNSGSGSEIMAKTTINSSSTTGLREHTLVICDAVETQEDSQPALSDREVSPKLIMGSKKYGRRSRPSVQTAGDCLLSDSEDGETDENEHRNCSVLTNAVQRSSSQTDIPGNRRRRPPTVNGGSKLKRCSSLPTQRNLQNQCKGGAATNKLKPLTATNQQQKTQFRKDETTSLMRKQPLSSSVESLDSPTLMESLPVHKILDIWEHANVANGRGILLALGFDEDEVNMAQLNKVLEEELRSLEDETQLTLLRASLALQTAELTALRQSMRQLHDENKKLRTSNKDANHRLALLAAEIDERHASLEDTSKKEIRSLEQRHANVVRELSARMANDREHWSNFTTRLESKLKTFEQEEIKLKTELELIRNENCELESEHQKLQKQITDLLEQNIQLNREVTELEENTRGEVREQHSDKNADDEMMRLVEKISGLQVENKSLRDKNDELVAEVEVLNVELVRTKSKNKKSSGSAVVTDANNAALEEVDFGANSTGTKRRGDSPSKTHITEESPRLGKLRKCTNDAAGSENSDTSGEWMALNSELRNSEEHKSMTAVDYVEQIAALKQQIAALEGQQKSGTDDVRVNNSTAEERCKELEASLEQMQRAYEDCEDYWQSKLAEERQLFEKERQIYEEEQHESDKKFTELMEKVREYEEQFSRDGRLSPIEEKDLLEQQYADLEAEANELKENARKLFEEKSKEIEALQSEIEDLRTRLGESVEILTGACELNSEAAAASALQLGADKHNSPASSPISYLWHQSTIQEPAKNYSSSYSAPESPSRQANRNNLSTSETTIFSTTPVETVTPIQKPAGSKASESETDDISSTASGKSTDSHSPASTHSARHSQSQSQSQTQNQTKTSPSPESSSSLGMKEELKRLKFFEISLREQVKDLSLQRDGLVMELQQLQEARPVLEKAYARTTHPNLIQRVNQLELRNRHLQNAIKQQQQHTESLMQRSWQQHQIELADLHNRIETQSSMIAEQAQRLQNADILVKDLYVENSHLAATVQRLEQNRARVNLMRQQQQRQGLNGLPGMP